MATLKYEKYIDAGISLVRICALKTLILELKPLQSPVKRRRGDL